MPWTQQDTNYGIFFQQNDPEGLITSILCNIRLQNTMHVLFANDACAENFISLLPPTLKIKRMSSNVDIVFPSSVSVLNTLIRTFSKIEAVPSELVDALFNAFNLNEYLRLEEMRNIFAERVKMIDQFLAASNKDQPEAISKHEMAADILDYLPKDSNAKLKLENSRLEKFLYSSPMERKLAKEKEQATRVICFSKSAEALAKKIAAPFPKKAGLTLEVDTAATSGVSAGPAIPSKAAAPKLPTSHADVVAAGDSPKAGLVSAEPALDTTPKSPDETTPATSMTALRMLKQKSRCVFGS